MAPARIISLVLEYAPVTLAMEALFATGTADPIRTVPAALEAALHHRNVHATVGLPLTQPTVSAITVKRDSTVLLVNLHVNRAPMEPVTSQVPASATLAIGAHPVRMSAQVALLLLATSTALAIPPAVCVTATFASVVVPAPAAPPSGFPMTVIHDAL